MNWTEFAVTVNHEVEPLVTNILENYGSNGSSYRRFKMI